VTGAHRPFAPAQIAYHVPDPERAAQRLARRFGWGPFFLFEHIALARCLYRGAPARFDHTSAYGQAGDLMVELITQHDDSPSVLRERFEATATGVHHVARFVADLPAALEAARADGTAVALEARTASGTDFAMLDTVADLGHMVELYVGEGDLLKFYRYVRRAAEGWDGGTPLRRLTP
jgi:hypothetical protein